MNIQRFFMHVRVKQLHSVKRENADGVNWFKGDICDALHMYEIHCWKQIPEMTACAIVETFILTCEVCVPQKLSRLL